MVKNLVSLDIKNVNDYVSCFSDIVVACNYFDGKTCIQNYYGRGEVQNKFENVLCNVFASFTYDIRYIS